MDAWIGMVLGANHADLERDKEPGGESESKRPDFTMRLIAWGMVAVVVLAGGAFAYSSSAFEGFRWGLG